MRSQDKGGRDQGFGKSGRQSELLAGFGGQGDEGIRSNRRLGRWIEGTIGNSRSGGKGGSGRFFLDG